MNLRLNLRKSTDRFSFYGDNIHALWPALARRTHLENQDNQATFKVFNRFDCIDTLGLSQVFFLPPRLPSMSDGSQSTGD